MDEDKIRWMEVSVDPDEAPGPEFWTWERLAQMGLLEPLGRWLSHLTVVVLLVGATVFFRFSGLPDTPAFVLTPQPANVMNAAALAGSIPQEEEEQSQTQEEVALPPFPTPAPVYGITRRLVLDTDIPQLVRTKPIKYTVRAGDTLASIAERFGLKVETIFWSNVKTLKGDAHTLRPGLELIIPPQDGILYEWEKGDTLQKVAEKFKVDPAVIVDFPTNELDPAVLVDDEASKNIPEGTLLFIPGAKLKDIDWRLPRFIRDKLAYSPLRGPGECGPIGYGPIGTYTFIWPTTTYIITTPYSVAHPAIDIAGKIGLPIFAMDHGVVVYAGWNNSGYGNVVVIDHGNGWKTLYAHQSRILVGCGQEVYQGQIIGSMGSTGRSTGPHVHIEMINAQYGKVNPLLFLPYKGK